LNDILQLLILQLNKYNKEMEFFEKITLLISKILVTISELEIQNNENTFNDILDLIFSIYKNPIQSDNPIKNGSILSNFILSTMNLIQKRELQYMLIIKTFSIFIDISGIFYFLKLFYYNKKVLKI
jgi:hypothetical protein